jgi:septal ring factor EnvC (AmiA/AmiB activator)
MSKRTLEQPESRREVRPRRDISFLDRLSSCLTKAMIEPMLCDESAMERRLMECEDRLEKYRLQLDQISVRHMQLHHFETNIRWILSDLNDPDVLFSLRRSNPAAFHRLGILISPDDEVSEPNILQAYQYTTMMLDENTEELMAMLKTIRAVKKTQTELRKSQRDCRNDLKCFRAVLGQ